MAQKFGFTSNSSPIDFLLEAFIDLSLLIGTLLGEGSSGRKKNPGLKFLDMSDELGNPKSIRVGYPSKKYWDPISSEIFKSLASFGVLIKRLQPGKTSFMEVFAGLSFVLPPKPLTAKEINQSRRKEQIRLRKARSAYFRRQRNKAEKP